MALDEERVASLRPGRFDDVLTADGLARFEQAIRRGRELLDGRTFWNVNSTARGGGVAEMLRSLIGYTRGADIDARWLVIEGDDEFFARHEAPAQPAARLPRRRRAARRRRARALRAPLRVQRRAAARPRLQPEDVVLLHDPQTAGMVPALVEAGVATIWRNHIGIDSPNDLAREAWRFLIPYVEPAHAYVFSRRSFSWEGLDEERIDADPAVHRRVLAEERDDGVHGRGCRAAGRGARCRPGPSASEPCSNASTNPWARCSGPPG